MKRFVKRPKNTKKALNDTLYLLDNLHFGNMSYVHKQRG